jgi:hypothetical protein
MKRVLLALALALSQIATPVLDAATLPRKAPEFVVKMPDGKDVPLSSYKGKGVILAFILTTCSHCQDYTRLLIKAQNEFGPKGLQVIESAIEQTAKANVPGFVRAFNPPFPVGFNEYMAAADFLEFPRTQVMHMPGVAFIDRSGKIVAQHFSQEPFIEKDPEANLRSMIQKILSPAGSPSPSKKAAVKK